ncbi:uncharacterized protein C8orf88 homolog isoform 2-T3 [Odontesthes bonariensis]|uniref:uncharacterized protein C8orf88 homolog isoform X2 n=1 Tax=Odontesthes bonariensis TaxID=219752 RepID=UPI003F583E49
MEVSRRRILLKHLEPARPLRRFTHEDVEPQIPAAACVQTLMEQQADVGIEQFYKIVNLCKQKQARISYTRDFLIGLANCPEAKKKPEYLPEHPIVLCEARDPGQLELREKRWNSPQDYMVAERLHSP